jgi:hypothetical protein
MMANSWLPTWAGTGWAVAFAVIVVMHVAHAARMSGGARWWHGCHVLMALGMVDMFWPHDLLVPARVWALIFLTSAACALAVVGAKAVTSARLHRLWGIAAVDLAAMAAMFGTMLVEMQWRWAPASVALAAWFLLEAAGWGGEALVRVAAAELHRSPAAVAPAGPRDAHARWLRCSLAVMSLGMAYMFLAMQFGSPMGTTSGPPEPMSLPTVHVRH